MVSAPFTYAAKRGRSILTWYSCFRFVIEAGCGYLREEYQPFLERLIEINKSNRHSYVTVGDLLLMTDKLASFVKSEAKGSKELVEMLLTKISNNSQVLQDNINDMFGLVNKYITSSRELSHDGRNHFVSIYASNDLVVLNGKLFHNKEFICDLAKFASIGSMLWTTASLDLFVEELIAA